uniref:DH domain-containing protein n=2 Tax=Monopterus albus TaxID=43700 RepID=A0A3Q3RDV3_MONAL
MAESEGKMPSPRRYRDREIYSDSKERQEVQRREGKRDTKSEGDGDERELRRERVRDKEREDLMYKHSRSEGDNKGKRAKERDQDGQGHREDKQRNRGREIEVDRSRKRGVEKERGRYREADRRAAREADRGGETWKESREDLKDDRSEDDKYKEYKQRRDREIKEREADPRWDNTTGRSSRFLNETAPRVPRQTLSSGEWSSDIDTEMRHRSRHSYEERESGREGATADERDVEQRDPERTAERSQRAQKRSERQERDTGETTGSLSAQRRMWLEPQRGKNSKEEFVNREIHTRGKERKREEETGIESQGQWEREGRRVKEEPNETYSDQSSYRGKHGGRNEYRRDVEEKTEGVSVDGEEVGEVWRETDNGGKEQLSDNDEGIEGSQQRDAEGENVTDNIEDGDREEEGGTGYFRFESEGGSETGWKHDKDRMLSGEDDFLTLSSGGDEDDEDEKFEDCQEFWEGGLAYDDASPVGFSGCEGGKEWDKDLTTEKEETVDKEEPGREKQPKYVFCVIGQTLPRSHHDDMSPSQADEMGSVERDNSISERCHHYSDDTAQQSQDDMHPSLFRNDEYPAINNRETELQDTETREGLRSQVELPCAEILQIRRESQTEKLLIEWREKNKELADAERKQPSPVPSSAHICSEVNFEQIQSIVDGLNSGAISPEEIEAIRIQMSTAWSLSDEPKRHSQAPHLKWAKNVVCKILGHSQEQTVNKPNSQLQGDQGVNETETAIKNGKEQEVLAQGTKEIPVVKLTTNEHAESELEEDVPLEVEGLRGMGQSQGDMHADQFTTMHGDTPTHTLAETQLDREGVEDNGMEREIEPSGHLQLEKADREMKITQEGGDGEVMVLEIEKEEHRETEMELCLPESNMLYKHNSCPILNYESDSDLPVPFSESKKQEVEDGMGESEEEMPEKEPEEMGTTEEVGKTRVEEAVEVEGRGEVMAEGKIEGGTQMIDSFRDLGPEARMRRRGIRKTTERRNGELFEVKEEEGVARDRRTRIFSLTDDEDDSSRSLGGVELRNVLDTLQRHKRKSKFFNATQLYQQYNEAAQNFEILSQSRSDVLHVREGGTSSPAPSPPPARRPLPALPPVLHPHSFFQTGSITSIQSLPLPEPPKSEGRSPSPRLSISLTQSATLWRDLPGVRNSHELEELTEDQMRLQEVRFEVVTSEASYRRSLDIVVEHFVKSKQLGALLTTKDRNWLFSRLTDVRAVSHR